MRQQAAWKVLEKRAAKYEIEVAGEKTVLGVEAPPKLLRRSMLSVYRGSRSRYRRPMGSLRKAFLAWIVVATVPGFIACRDKSAPAAPSEQPPKGGDEPNVSSKKPPGPPGANLGG